MLSMTIQGSFTLDWLVWFPCSPKDSEESSPTARSFWRSKASILWYSAFFIVQLSHPWDHWKSHGFERTDLCQWCLWLLICCVGWPHIFFQGRSFNFMATVTIYSDSEPKKLKSVTVSVVFPSICQELMGLNAMIFNFWMCSFKPAFLHLQYY